jgi:hypothetical protein
MGFLLPYHGAASALAGAANGKGDKMQKFLTLNELVTPTIIRVVYWIGIALIILGALSSMFGGFGAFLIGLVGAAIGLVLWRVWCEVMLILFRIHDDLSQIARNTAPAGAMPPRP